MFKQLNIVILYSEHLDIFDRSSPKYKMTKIIYSKNQVLTKVLFIPLTRIKISYYVIVLVEGCIYHKLTNKIGEILTS